MTQRRWLTPVRVIADDFTGANDAGSGLAQAGARVNVLFDSEQPDPGAAADVWVVNTDSRALPAPQAAERMRRALALWPRQADSGWLFKKIDSTLRGNLGVETEAALLYCGAPLALVVPAVPELGRITRAGQCYIHGRLLTDTEFASDPKTPVTTASVVQRLREQSDLPCGLLTLAQVRGDRLTDDLAQAAQEVRMLVVDAENREDLMRIMQAAAALPQRPLLVGAAGLSQALGELLAPRPPAPVLAVVGSMSEMTRLQVSRLQQRYPVTLVDIEIDQLFSHSHPSHQLRWQQAVTQALRAGQHCVIRTCQHDDQRAAIAALCEQHRLNRAQLGEQICAELAMLTRAVLAEVQPAGLYLSGGDVAIAVARGLGASGFALQGQIAGCVPWGRLLNVTEPRLVMTKAGGFGDADTLVDVIRFIEEKSSE